MVAFLSFPLLLKYIDINTKKKPFTDETVISSQEKSSIKEKISNS